LRKLKQVHCRKIAKRKTGLISPFFIPVANKQTKKNFDIPKIFHAKADEGKATVSVCEARKSLSFSL
jgi:hypothetical protein